MVDRPRLEAVLLDAGGTLVRLDFEWMAETVTGLGFALDAARLRRAEIEGRRRFDAFRETPVGPARPSLAARADTRAYFGGMLEAAAVPVPVVEAALERFRARQEEDGLWTRPMEGAREALDELAALGLRLAVVSNSDGRAEQHLVECGVREGLEFVVDSHRVGIEKPDPGIFRVALERLGVRPERALFVGDVRAVDETGARAAGMRFVLLDPFGDYAPPGGDAIPGIHRLPAWVVSHFALDAKGGRAAR